MVTGTAAASAVSVAVDVHYHLHFDLPVIETGTVLPELTATCFISHDTGPPGGDLVVSLRRLLI
jgi:hypothetical protein